MEAIVGAIALGLLFIVVFIVIPIGGALLAFAARFEAERLATEERGEAFDEDATVRQILEEAAKAQNQPCGSYGPTTPGFL